MFSFDRIDPEKIGLFGHSLGGAAVVAVGRQRDDISAVIDLEGTMLGEYQGYADGKHTYCEASYPLPLLDVNSRQVYELAKSGTKEQYVNFYVGDHAEDFREIVIEDAGHMNFCDLRRIVRTVIGHHITHKFRIHGRDLSIDILYKCGLIGMCNGCHHIAVRGKIHTG